MKKLITLISLIAVLTSLSACGEKTTNDISTGSSSSVSCTSADKTKSASEIIKVNSEEEAEELITKDVEETIAELESEIEKLTVDIDSYDKYKDNIDTVSDFCDTIQKETELLCIRLEEYSAAYAEFLISSDKSFDDKYDELDFIYDNIYDEACEEIYDRIYDDILDEFYDKFYDGILDKAYDEIPYKEWSDARSDAYDLWSDTRSAVYDLWSDTRSDIYDFWSDMRSKVYKKNEEKANKKLADFKEDIDTLKKKAAK